MDWLKCVPSCRCLLWQWHFKKALSITCGSLLSTMLSPLFCKSACHTADVPCHRQFWTNCPSKATAAALALRHHLNLQKRLHPAELLSLTLFMQRAVFGPSQSPDCAVEWHLATPLLFTSALPCSPVVHAPNSQDTIHGVGAAAWYTHSSPLMVVVQFRISACIPPALPDAAMYLLYIMRCVPFIA